MRAAVALLLLVCAATAAPAQARSVNDPDIGWPDALRQELRLAKVDPRPCGRDISRAGIRLQSRVSRRDPRDGLYRLLHDRPSKNIWGNLWYDPCKAGRLFVGVAAGAPAGETRTAVASARAFLRRIGLTRDVRLVAVRSSYRELSDALDALEPTLAPLEDQGLVSYGVETSRNTIVVDVASVTTAEQRAQLFALGAAAPVNVVVHVSPAPPPTYVSRLDVIRSSVDRARRTFEVVVTDGGCPVEGRPSAEERFEGVEVRRTRFTWVLTAVTKTDPGRGFAACYDDETFTRTVTLPAPVGRRGLVDGVDPEVHDVVQLPPLGRRGIRSLVPPLRYGSEDCDDPTVRGAFRGTPKQDWCFY